VPVLFPDRSAGRVAVRRDAELPDARVVQAEDLRRLLCCERFHARRLTTTTGSDNTAGRRRSAFAGTVTQIQQQQQCRRDQTSVHSSRSAIETIRSSRSAVSFRTTAVLSSTILVADVARLVSRSISAPRLNSV